MKSNVLTDRAPQRLTIISRIFYPSIEGDSIHLMDIAPDLPNDPSAMNSKVICLYSQQVLGGKKILGNEVRPVSDRVCQ